MGEDEKLEGGQLFIDNQPWDGVIHDFKFETPAEQQEENLIQKLAPVALSLKVEPTPELVKFMTETWEETYRRMVEAVKYLAEMCKSAGESMRTTLSFLGNCILDKLLYKANNNPKWWHLYKHAKKARTRKKYKNKLYWQYLKKLEIAKIARESLND